MLRTVHDYSLHRLRKSCWTSRLPGFNCRQYSSAKFSTSASRFAPSVPVDKPVTSGSRPVKGPSTPPRFEYRPSPNIVRGPVRTLPGLRGSMGVLEARKKADEARRKADEARQLKELQLQQDLERREQKQRIMEEARRQEAAELQRDVERLKREWLMQQQRDRKRAAHAEEIRLQAIARVEQLRLEWPELDSSQRQDVVRKLQFSDALRKVMLDRASLLYQDVSMIHHEQQRQLKVQREREARERALRQEVEMRERALRQEVEMRERARREELEMRELARQRELKKQGGVTIDQAQHRQIEVFATDQSAVKVQLRDRYRKLQRAFQGLGDCVRSTHDCMEGILATLTIIAKSGATNARPSRLERTNESSTGMVQKSNDPIQSEDAADSTIPVHISDGMKKYSRELYHFTSLQWSRLAIDYLRHSRSHALAAHDMRAIVRFRRFVIPDEGPSGLSKFRVLRQCAEIDTAHYATQTARSIFLEIDPLVNDKLPVNKLSYANRTFLSSLKCYSLTRRNDLNAGRMPVIGTAQHDPQVLATARGKEVLSSLSPRAAESNVVATKIRTLNAQVFRLNVERFRHILTTNALAEQKLFHMSYAIQKNLAAVSMDINAVNKSSAPVAIRSCVESTQKLIVALRSPIARAGDLVELNAAVTDTQRLLAALRTLREAGLSATGRRQVRDRVRLATKRYKPVFDGVQEWKSAAARWARHAEKGGLLKSEAETLRRYLKARIEELKGSPKYLKSPRANTSNPRKRADSASLSSKVTTLPSRARARPSRLRSRPRKDPGSRSVKPSHLGSTSDGNVQINAPNLGTLYSSGAAEPKEIQQDDAKRGSKLSSGSAALDTRTQKQVTQDQVTSETPASADARPMTRPAVITRPSEAVDMDRSPKLRIIKHGGPDSLRTSSRNAPPRSRRRRTSKPMAPLAEPTPTTAEDSPGEWGISNSVPIGGFHPTASLRAGFSGTTAANADIEEDGTMKEDVTAEEDSAAEEDVTVEGDGTIEGCDAPDHLVGILDQPEKEFDGKKVTTYKLSETAVAAAQLAKPGQEVFWQYNLFHGPDGAPPRLYYCHTKSKVEEVAQHFLESDVLGFDMEWMSNASKDAPIKDQVSLIQFASEDRIALFQLALHKGTEIDDLIGPTLRLLLESPGIIKAGVGIKADCTRLERCLGVKAQGVFELTHTYKLIKSEDEVLPDAKKKRTGLAAQVKDMFGMNLHKGAVRYGRWNYKLDAPQCLYAASDAYAGYQLFWELERHRLAMRPTPPRPAFAEQTTSSKASRSTVSEPASSESQL